MAKRLAVSLILIGIIIIGIGGYKIAVGVGAQHQTMAKAKMLVNLKMDPIQYDEWDPQPTDVIGILFIPKLKKELPIVQGTSADQLEKGVGHYKTSALPGRHDQIVLSGHRNTVFRHFGELKIGDHLIVKTAKGSFTYTIRRMKIVDADDRTIIHTTRPKEELVLTTCYPFHYVGNAPKRYIVYAYPDKS